MADETERPARSGRITKQARRVFVGELERGVSVTGAAKASGVHVRRWYELRDRDEVFAQQWADAYGAGTDFLRDELRRRAVEGADDIRLDRDGNEHPLKVYSDRLLELELKRRDASYRERAQLEVTGAGGAPLEVGLRLEPDYAAILDGLEEAGVLIRGPAAAGTIYERKPTPPEPKALEAGEVELGADDDDEAGSSERPTDFRRTHLEDDE